MIFVTGASGLIGGFVCRRLVKEGHTIRALKRSTSDLSNLLDIKNEIDWVEGDILDVNLISKCLDQVDTVIHCAAIVSFDLDEREKLFKINVEGTANIVNACLQSSVKRLVHVSSVAAIGRGKPDGKLDEDTLWENSKDNTYYAKSKYLSELEVWRGVEEGLNAFIVNPSVVLGPGEIDKSSTKAFGLVQKNSSVYSSGYLNYIDVRDVVDILIKLMETEVTGERFILNAGRVTVKEFYTETAKQLSLKKPKHRITYKMAVFGLWFFRLKRLLTGKKSAINSEILKTLKKSHYFDNQKIVSYLNYEFIPFNESVKWTVSELKKMKQL